MSLGQVESNTLRRPRCLCQGCKGSIAEPKITQLYIIYETHKYKDVFNGKVKAKGRKISTVILEG